MMQGRWFSWDDLAKKDDEMTTQTRQCPFDGCARRIRPEIFACRSHWFSLNGRQKAAIWSAYEAWKTGNIDGDELRRRQKAVLDEVQGKAS